MDNIPYQREDIETALKAEITDKHMRPAVTIPELLSTVIGEV
jgi:hypothetical protein